MFSKIYICNNMVIVWEIYPIMKKLKHHFYLNNSYTLAQMERIKTLHCKINRYLPINVYDKNKWMEKWLIFNYFHKLFRNI